MPRRTMNSTKTIKDTIVKDIEPIEAMELNDDIKDTVIDTDESFESIDDNEEKPNKITKKYVKVMNKKPSVKDSEGNQREPDYDYYWLDAIENKVNVRNQKIDSIIPIEDMLDNEAIDCIMYFTLYAPKQGYIVVHYDELYVEYFFNNLFNSIGFESEKSRLIFVKSLAQVKSKLSTYKLKNTFDDIPEDVLLELIKGNENILNKIKKGIM